MSRALTLKNWHREAKTTADVASFLITHAARNGQRHLLFHLFEIATTKRIFEKEVNYSLIIVVIKQQEKSIIYAIWAERFLF